MWHRTASALARTLARKFPAIALLGARQVGKTTLARSTFPKMPYCDLERPDLRALFASDPAFQIRSRAKPAVILDEVQAVPAVFSALRGIIDEDRRANGRFILLGSAQPDLVRAVSENRQPPTGRATLRANRHRRWHWEIARPEPQARDT